MEVPANLVAIMIVSGIVFIVSICLLIYGLRMDSGKPKSITDTTGKFSSYKVGRHVTLAPKAKFGTKSMDIFRSRPKNEVK